MNSTSPEATQSDLEKQLDRDEMDWDAYAEYYDELCDLNPAYQENIEILLDRLKQWHLPEESHICDMGAGTGNYIVELNRHLPNAKYWHIDFDVRMNDLAKRKYESNEFSNVSIIQEEAHNVSFPSESFDLIICINALYTFTPQEQVLKNMRNWLKPDGRLFVIDFGRQQSTLDWTIYIFRESLKAHRVGKYARTLLEGREILKQNRKATKGQQSGRYWLHTTEEFGDALRDAGFKIHELESCYREYADLAICSK